MKKNTTTTEVAAVIAAKAAPVKVAKKADVAAPALPPVKKVVKAVPVAAEVKAPKVVPVVAGVKRVTKTAKDQAAQLDALKVAGEKRLNNVIRKLQKEFADINADAAYEVKRAGDYFLRTFKEGVSEVAEELATDATYTVNPFSVEVIEKGMEDVPLYSKKVRASKEELEVVAPQLQKPKTKAPNKAEAKVIAEITAPAKKVVVKKVEVAAPAEAPVKKTLKKVAPIEIPAKMEPAKPVAKPVVAATVAKAPSFKVSATLKK